MKKVLALVLALIMVLGLSAAIAEDYHFEIVSKGFQSTYWQAVLKGANEEVEKINGEGADHITINFVGPDSESDVAQQVQQFTSALNANPAAIGFAAVDQNAFNDLLAEAVEKVTAGYDLPAGVPVLLFVGRMMTYKGLPLILDALKLLMDAGQDFRMVFIGKGPDKELMEDKARSLGLEKRCIFVGPVYDREALRAWNTRADLFLFPSTFDTNGLVVREAAACGLGCVLVRGSCAAEGIDDGRNGFLIEESAEAMAALLKEICPDLVRLHQVGQHAMREIYLSWQSAVDAAYDRYGAILDLKRSGKLPPKRKVPTDYLVALASRSMEERVRRRRIRLELLNDFRETAQGMMENIQEAQRSAEQRWAKVAEDIQRELDALHRE